MISRRLSIRTKEESNGGSFVRSGHMSHSNQSQLTVYTAILSVTQNKPRNLQACSELKTIAFKAGGTFDFDDENDAIFESLLMNSGPRESGPRKGAGLSYGSARSHRRALILHAMAGVSAILATYLTPIKYNNAMHSRHNIDLHSVLQKPVDTSVRK